MSQNQTPPTKETPDGPTPTVGNAGSAELVAGSFASAPPTGPLTTGAMQRNANLPTVGRIVMYRLSQEDVATIEQRRTRRPGTINPHSPGQVLPAIVVHPWGTCANLRVFCDGDLDLWVTSAEQGERDRQWMWPART